MEVLERSTQSLDSSGKPLYLHKIDLPTKLKLERDGYTIEVATPVNDTPVIFLTATNKGGINLRLMGKNVVELERGSGMYTRGARYSYLIGEANSGIMEFNILDASSDVIGSEYIKYDVISRGFTTGVDSL